MPCFKDKAFFLCNSFLEWNTLQGIVRKWNEVFKEIELLRKD